MNNWPICPKRILYKRQEIFWIKFQTNNPITKVHLVVLGTFKTRRLSWVSSILHDEWHLITTMFSNDSRLPPDCTVFDQQRRSTSLLWKMRLKMLLFLLRKAWTFFWSLRNCKLECKRSEPKEVMPANGELRKRFLFETFFPDFLNL